MGRLVISIALILILSAFASAADKWPNCASTYMFDGGRVVSEAKSPKDGLYLEMPDNLALMELATVKVYVNDPFIKKNANLIEFLCDPGSCAIASPGGELDYDSGYPFTNMPYSGEAVIELKMRNAYTDARKSGINYLALRFLQMKAPLAAGEYDKCQVQSNKNGTSWYQYQCLKGSPYKKLCGQEKCDVGYKRLGMVAKQFKSHIVRMQSSPPTIAANRPSSMMPTDEVFQSKYEGYQATTPSGKQEYCSRGMTIGIYTNVAMESVKQMDSNFGANAKKYAPTQSPGGLAAGKSFELYERDAAGTPTCDHIGCGELFDYDMGYTIISDMQPEGTGTIRASVSKKDCVPMSNLKAEVQKTVAETKAFLASYKQAESTPSDFRGLVCSDVKAAPTEPGTLSGRITDGHNHPMAYMKIIIETAGKETNGYTDEAGNYQFKDVKGLKPDDKDPPEATLKIDLSYFRDGKNYFFIVGNDGKPVRIEKTFKLKTDSDLRQDMDLKDVDGSGNSKTMTVDGCDYKIANWGMLWVASHLGGIYYYTGDAADFYKTILNAKLDNLPLKVYIGGEDTYYSPNGFIRIGGTDAIYTSPDRPKNREYHEFSHYLMYSEYGSWPDGRSLPKTENHAGFLNPSTADSYLEGFAEFMAMTMAEYTDDPEVAKPPEQYPTGWNAESNIKVWERRGRSEERAIAGVLWDIRDKNNEPGDEMTVSLQQMWPILKVKRRDFSEYVKAFKQAFPDKAQAIDKICVLHGIWADNNTGNKTRDEFEPYWPSAEGAPYAVGDFFVDYGIKNGTIADIKHDPGETVGSSSNYERKDRGKGGLIPDAFIRVSDEKVRFYTVSVHFNNPSDGPDMEYTSEARQGLLYVDPPQEGIDATITVKPKSEDYVAGSVYTISSKDYDRKWYASEGKGSYDQHDFKLKPTGQRKDPQVRTLDGKPPAWNNDGGYDYRGTPPTMNGSPLMGPEPKTICPCLPLLPLILAGLSAALAKI